MVRSADSFTRQVLLGLTSVTAVALVVLFCFDPSRYHFYPVCIFHQVTGLLCPGCGALRSSHQLLHGNFMAAFRLNGLFVMGLPLCALRLLAQWFRGARPGSRPASPRSPWLWLFPLLLIVLAFGVWRNLPGSPLAMLPR